MYFKLYSYVPVLSHLLVLILELTSVYLSKLFLVSSCISGSLQKRQCFDSVLHNSAKSLLHFQACHSVCFSARRLMTFCGSISVEITRKFHLWPQLSQLAQKSWTSLCLSLCTILQWRLCQYSAAVETGEII